MIKSSFINKILNPGGDLFLRNKVGLIAENVATESENFFRKEILEYLIGNKAKKRENTKV